MKLKFALAGMALVCSVAVHAECVYPKAPDSIPDGKSASEQEMVAAMTAFKQYNTDVNTYLSCLDQETTSKVSEAGGSAGQIVQIKALQSKKHNAAVEELQVKAAAFNEQVRLFKSKKG